MENAERPARGKRKIRYLEPPHNISHEWHGFLRDPEISGAASANRHMAKCKSCDFEFLAHKKALIQHKIMCKQWDDGSDQEDSITQEDTNETLEIHRPAMQMVQVLKRQSVVSTTDADDKFNREFIAAIKAERCLYDFKLANYSNKTDQTEAWERLSERFQESVLSLRSRWKNLRAGLTRHIRMKLLLEQSGSRRAVKPYYLLSEMEFLIPYTRAPKPTSMEDHLTESDSGDNYLCESEQDILYVDGDERKDWADPLTVDDEQEAEPELKYYPEEETEIPIPKKLKRTEEPAVKEMASTSSTSNPVSQTNDNRVEAIEPSTSRSSANDYEQTAEWHFFRSLMPDIQSMNANQRRKMRVKFLGVIDEILDKD